MTQHIPSINFFLKIVHNFYEKKPPPCNFIKKRQQLTYFPVSFNDFLRSNYMECLLATAFSSFIFNLFWLEKKDLHDNGRLIQ